VYYAGTSSISANVPQGASTTATPDGRHAHTPLAEGVPQVMQWIKMDQHLCLNQFLNYLLINYRGVLLNQKVNPQMLSKRKIG